MKIRSFKELGKYIRSVNFKVSEERKEFSTTLDEIGLHPVTVKLMLENGRTHKIGGTTFVMNMLDKLQTIVWYNNIYNTSGKFFTHLAIAAIFSVLDEDKYNCIGKVGSFLRGSFDDATESDIKAICMFIDAMDRIEDLYIPWDNESDENKDPYIQTCYILQQLCDTYDLDKPVIDSVYDVYRLKLAYNLVAYEETGNHMYIENAYRDEIYCMHVKIVSMSI